MIKVDKKRGIYNGETHVFRVGHRHGKVLFVIDGAALEFKVPIAFQLGWDMVVKSGELLPNEFVVVTINQKTIELPKEQGLQVGGALLRKCDDADDYQLQHPERISA